jgi:inosine-uridine nucleoside N-ribohydrolase
MPDSRKQSEKTLATFHNAVSCGGYPTEIYKNSKPVAAKRPVILDVDTGRDDAWTILGALDELKVRAIIAGYGNISQTQAVRNALDVLRLGQRALHDIKFEQGDIKVWEAEAGPMTPTAAGLKEIARRACINGNGLCNLIIPASPEEQVETPSQNWAEAFAASLRQSSEKVDYLACGPMTNLSYLIDAFERLEGDRQAIKKYVSRVIAMGGCIDPALPVDFNFKADPASAQKVIEVFGADMTLVPFDESRKLRLTESDIQALKPQDLAAAFSRDLMLAQSRGWSADGTVMLHDPATLLVAGENVSTRIERVSVQLDGEEAGRLVHDDKGVDVRRLSISPEQVSSYRARLLNKYLNLTPPLFQPKA